MGSVAVLVCPVAAKAFANIMASETGFVPPIIKTKGMFEVVM
jgi:hypothetical protein